MSFQSAKAKHLLTVLQELLNASASSRKPSRFRANLNLDADEHLTLPNYHESTRTEESDEKGLPSLGKQQKPPSLFEEILASEQSNSMAAAGTGTFLQSPSKIPVMKSSGSPPNGGDHHQSSPSTSLGPAEAVSLGNDDNNNRVLSKKPSLELEEPTALLETLPTNVSPASVGAPKEKAQISRSNSAGSGDNSKSESKSDSFEIDW